MVRTIDTVEEFLSELQICDVSDNPFLTYAYYSVFSQKVSPKQFLCFLVCDEQGNTVAMLPLEKAVGYWRIFGYRASNYLGIIAPAGKEITCLIEIEKYIQKNQLNLAVCYYDINDQTSEYIYFHDGSKYKEVYLYSCPVVDVNRDFSELFLQKVTSSKKRTELKKFRKKLSLLGNINYVNIDSKDLFEKNRELFHQLFRVHRERFHIIYPPDAFCFYSNEEYYTELLLALVSTGKAIISILSVDGAVISFLVTLIENNVVIDWMPAFDPALSKYSVGNVHLMMFLESLCGDPKYTLLDFSKGLGTYKDRWSDFVTNNYAYIVAYGKNPLTQLQAKAAGAFFELKSWMRKKGILEKIKGKRVKRFCEKNKRNEPVVDNDRYQIRRVSGVEELGQQFSYSELIEAPERIRKEIAESIYSGAAVGIEKNGEAYTILMLECTR